MNSQQRAAMQMAYDWFNWMVGDGNRTGFNAIDVKDALHEALAQPQDCKECGAKQAKIDSLMLEYCPDEITDEQMAEWAKYQTPVQECRHCGWLCKPTPNNQKFLEALRKTK